MAITITTDLVDVNLAEATTAYSVLGTWATAIAASPDTWVQSANTIGGRCSANQAWAYTTMPVANTNLSTGVHIFQWLKCISVPDLATTTNGGLRIVMSSDAVPTLVGTAPANGLSNSKSWYVNGSEAALSGWICYVVDPNSASSVVQGVPVVTTINNIGIGAYVLNTVGGGAVKPVNILFDATRYGTGLTYAGDNTGVAGHFSDILTTAMSITTAWGILTSDSGIYFGAGKINFGTSAQAATTTFLSTGELFIWRNMPVATSFYNWNIVGASGFTTTVTLGAYSGGITSSGTLIKGVTGLASSTISTWSLTVGAYTAVNLYGSTFQELNSATFQSTTTVRGCAFIDFGSITPNQAIIANCSFSSVNTAAPISATYALLTSSVADITNITNCSFIKCNRAIKITVAGTYTFSGLTFSGNTYDIENASTGAVTINATNGSNPTTYINTGSGATTSIVNSVSLSVTVVDSSNSPIVGNGTSTGARVSIYASSTIVLTSASWATNVASYTTSAAHGLNVGGTIVITGVIPSGYNGIYTIATVPTTTTFTITQATNPGTYVQGGSVKLTILVPTYTNASGVVTGTFNYVGNTNITVRARLDSPGGSRYYPVDSSGTITTTGYSSTITMIKDTIAV